ncbi:ankyrin repeat domain-containing protein [Blomia tropicalis]|nr:ankyrin repeat domain-containing protein [Blomia tropicalis]
MDDSITNELNDQFMQKSNLEIDRMSTKGQHGDDMESDNISEEPEEHPILKAAEKGKLDLVKQMIQMEPWSVNVSDVDGYTPLHRASYNNRIEVVKYLIENGANVRAKTMDGWEPIHSAAQWGNVQIVRILMASGGDINARSNGGNTPFHLAVSRPSNRPLIEYMLYSDDVDIEAKNDAVDTAYDICKRNSRLYKLWDLL